MSYCLNPTCRHPENPSNSQLCQSCGSEIGKLRDRYHVIKALAQGGFGATFLAHDEGLPGEPTCVIKQLRPSTSAPEVMKMARELFMREAKTLGKIGNHPQVPRLLDYFEENQQFYLVQEFINGSTLQQEIKRSGAFTEVQAREFLSDILTILKYIHERQVIHRDIKPANLIRRNEDGKLVLIDFGAVKNQVNQILPSQTEQTALTAFSVGTSGFAPPEQIALRPVYASDIYAVGVTCIYLLTAKAPKDLDYNSLTGEMLWEQEVKVSPHLMKVLKKMLEASVRHRYQSADEALRALELESYIDDMADAMAARPAASKASSNQAQASSSSSTSVSAVAAAIRARRNKSVETTNAQPGVARQQVTPHKTATVAQPGVARQQVASNKTATVGAVRTATNTNIKQTPKTAVPVDSKSFLMAYLNGRRDFIGLDLKSLSLERSNLSGVNFHTSKLDKTNFQGANLFNSDFGQASLSQANLRDANLSKAYLSHADLSKADLRGADLSHAYLNHANLRGANLCGANLTGAKITEEQLAQAKTNWMTIKPNGRRALL